MSSPTARHQLGKRTHDQLKRSPALLAAHRGSFVTAGIVRAGMEAGLWALGLDEGRINCEADDRRGTVGERVQRRLPRGASHCASCPVIAAMRS